MTSNLARITVGPVWARLEAHPAVVAVVRDGLAVFDPTAQHTPAFKAHRWDGRVEFYRRANNEFLSGLTWRVLGLIRAAGVLERPTVAWPEPMSFEPLGESLRGMEWRPYQTDSVEKAVRARRMVLQCPTRGGKTEIAIEFCRRIGGKALWVTHTEELIRQTPQRFMDRLGLECGVVQGKTRTDGRVVVGMVQTLARMAAPTVKSGVDNPNKRRTNPDYDPDFFKQFDVLVVDEIHHGGADTWQDVMRACTRAAWRLGLSGTVGDEIVKLPVIAALKIEGAIGPTYTAATTMGLAGDGFVAAPRVVMLRVPPTTYPSYEEVRQAVCPHWRDDPRKLLSKLGGQLFAEAYRRGVTENDARNARVVETAVRHADAGDKFLVLCNRVAHAEALWVAIERRTTAPVLVLDGGAPSERRAVVLDEFKATGGGAVLVCTPFFREGVDVPQIDAGVLAGGGASDVAVLQALGRMLTARSDKKEVLIYDMIDGRDSRQPKDYLAQHYCSRLELYKRSGFIIERA